MTSVVGVVMLIMVVMLIWLRCLTTRAAAELPIDTSRVVKVRTNHVQAARLEDRLLLGLEVRLVLLLDDLVRLSEIVLQLRGQSAVSRQ